VQTGRDTSCHCRRFLPLCYSGTYACECVLVWSKFNINLKDMITAKEILPLCTMLWHLRLYVCIGLEQIW